MDGTDEVGLDCYEVVVVSQSSSFRAPLAIRALSICQIRPWA